MRMGILIQVEAEEVIDGRVARFGNGAHVLVPKAWIGEEVKVVRLK
jgi:putative transposon-encoded protein